MKIITFLLFLLFLGCTSSAQDDKAKLDSLFKLGLKADSIGDYQSSIIYYNQVLKIDSLNFGAYANRGKALIATSKIKEGFSDLNKAIKIYPNEKTYYIRAIAYLYNNNLDSAEKDLKTVMNLNSLFPDAYMATCELHLLKKEYLPALYNFQLANKYKLIVNKSLWDGMQSELSTALSPDVVTRFNYDTILQTIKDIPVVKKAEEASFNKNQSGLSYGLKLNKAAPWIYIITVRNDKIDKTQFIFNMDAATLKVLNPEGKY